MVKPTDEVTASELLNELKTDERFLARQSELERSRASACEQSRLELAPVLLELQGAGFRFDSLDDLRGSGTNYEGAVDVLVRWLPKIRDANAKESIVRTLSVPWARQAAPLLIAEFQKPSASTELRWVIGNALAVVADDSVIDSIEWLAKNTDYGRAREMLALSLGNMRSPRAVATLLDLLDDEDVAGHAIMALGKLRAVEAVKAIEPFLRHRRAWVRKEAARALKRIGMHQRGEKREE